MDKKEILSRVDSYCGLIDEIKSVIDYNSEINITPCLECEWSIEGGLLHINFGGEDGLYEYAGLEISSLGALGKKLFMGEKDGISFIMAYDDGLGWEHAYVYILDNKKRIYADADE